MLYAVYFFILDVVVCAFKDGRAGCFVTCISFLSFYSLLAVLLYYYFIQMMWQKSHLSEADGISEMNELRMFFQFDQTTNTGGGTLITYWGVTSSTACKHTHGPFSNT